jgi:hypothetical protein
MYKPTKPAKLFTSASNVDVCPRSSTLSPKIKKAAVATFKIITIKSPLIFTYKRLTNGIAVKK